MKGVHQVSKEEEENPLEKRRHDGISARLEASLLLYKGAAANDDRCHQSQQSLYTIELRCCLLSLLYCDDEGVSGLKSHWQLIWVHWH